MAKKLEISHDNFEKLLEWLHSDREKAGQKYELIRNQLIKIFYARGSYSAEEMADETIDRVAGKIKHLSEIYQGEPALYFYAVAKKVYLEYSRKPRHQDLPATLVVKEQPADETSEIYSQCLDKCLAALPGAHLELINKYYQGEKKVKIERRKKLAEQFGISTQALRVRALRLRGVLQKCVLRCVKEISETF